MALTPEEQPILEAELATDPVGRGYAAMTDQEVADSLRSVIDQSRVKPWMTPEQALAAIDVTELSGLTISQISNFWGLMSLERFDPGDTGIARAIFINLFGAGSNTVSRLNAERQELVSRAVFLGIPNVYVTDVTRARGG